jgi:multisubunit Na+/H+ antiporter MnhC subunit
MTASQQQTRRARRAKRRLPIAFAGMFSAIVVGFALIAVLLWVFVK